MSDHNYRIRLTTKTVKHVVASTVQLHGDHLVFTNSNGQPTALFLKNLVRSWSMLPNVLPDVHGGTSIHCCRDSDPDGLSTLSTR